MTRLLSVVLACPVAVILSAAVVTSPSIASEPAPSRCPEGLAKQTLEITDAVLDHHVDPPSRQQMVLSGIKRALDAAGTPAPAGLARRVSDRLTPDQLAALVVELWPQRPPNGKSDKGIEDAFLSGLLESVPGAALQSAKELKIAEQIDGNLYVGIQIALAYDDKAKQPQIAEVFEGGPADRVGVKKGDWIEDVDGRPTKDHPLSESIDWLRGEEGTDVAIKVRRANVAERLSFTITRGRLPRPTIAGIRKRPSGEWDIRFEGPDRIGYLRVVEITGSTPHELRVLAGRLESEGASALIVDLRAVDRAVLHPTVLLADELLDGGPIGRVRTAGRVDVYEAEPDALLRGRPLVVLVDEQTSGPAEWLAAALQDNHRAALVGTPTAGGVFVAGTVPVGDGSLSIQMTTGRLERGDGRPLGGSLRPAPPRRLPPFGRGLGPAEPRSGVEPDHLIKTSRPPAGRLAPNPPEPSQHGGGTGKVQDLSQDPAVLKAVELIRQAVKPT